MSKEATVFVTGATGGQGGAITKYLLSSGASVNALIRDPSSPSALSLQKAGAALYPGDFSSPTSLLAAAQNCTSLFLNVSPTHPDQSLEFTHAQNIITAAKEAGIKHCVVSTASQAENYLSFKTFDPSNKWLVNYWSNKKKIQELVQENFERWTVLQPGWLMSIFIAPVSAFPFGELGKERVLVNSFGWGTKVQVCSGDTVGRFGARALLGEEMDGKVVMLAGEELDIEEVAGIMSEVGGVEVGVRYRSEEETEQLKGVNPIVATQFWQKVDGTGVDLDEVRRWGIELMGFREFLEGHKERLRAALGLE